MQVDRLRSLLQNIRQDFLLDRWDFLDELAKEQLALEIDSLNLSQIVQQQQILRKKVAPLDSVLESFQNYRYITSEAIRKERIKISFDPLRYKIGCLIVAGGQGTRLKWNGPKGTFPVSLIKQKSLFQLLSEKIVAASHLHGYKIPLAVMTSPENHRITIEFFKKHCFFGLDPAYVDFFQQEELPLLDLSGNLFLESTSHIAKGPNGNGEALKSFYSAGLWKKWKSLDIESVYFSPIDNPLALPYDAVLIKSHMESQADVTIKCVPRIDLNENVGLVVKKDHKISVVEYSELPTFEQTAIDEQGNPKHICANISIFCFSMDFVQRAALDYTDQMPWHLAKKAARYLNAQGITDMSQQPIAWKFEKFIFDLLPFTSKVNILLYPRESCFAPLKNARGSDSLETVQAALLKADCDAYHMLSGIYPSSARRFELDAQFYYPNLSMQENWLSRALPPFPYIEPFCKSC
ncbi:MAG: glmu3 [Chlamydiales bacterium]|jgi:UDP-N-acetylglucosamine/UDP-N-acetylgalactosamine diphosphorylase|nr:glmu3 [Chlamydiales bacterium]